MIPKVIFRYSWIYDQRWKKWMEEVSKYPSTEEVLNYIKEVEKLWRKNERKIFKELSRVTGLRWKSKIIYCYVVGKCKPFSDPLTMPVYKEKDYFIDVLVHELIHRLLSEEGNKEKTRKVLSYIKRKYKNESEKTKLHVLIHAIHWHIYLKFFDEKRLKRNIKLVRFSKDYSRAWKIVEKEGYERIIKKLKS